jgi:photosystem II stability/assembly factor-like uncharacterized protein
LKSQSWNARAVQRFVVVVGFYVLLFFADPYLRAQQTSTAGDSSASKPADAQQKKPEPGTAASLSGSLKWRLVGPFRGGRVLAVTGVPGQPLLYYFGAAAGGVWKSTNDGVTWNSVFDSQPISSIGAIAISDSNPNIIYVGTGESCIRGDISFGDGIYKSIDGGQHWTNIGLKNTEYISSISIDPSNPDVVLVAALGHAWGPNPDRGVFRTTDGGKNWQKVLYKDDHTGAIDLAVDSKNPSVVYAALWQAQRSAWHLDSGGPGSGIYKSTDAGITWKQLEKGLPKGPLGRIGIAVSSTNPARVYALIEADKGGLYSSDDGGDSWKLVNSDHRFRQRPWYFTHIYADPQNADRVYILSVEMYRSNDGGKIFSTLHAPHSDYHDLWIDPKNPQRMIVSNDGGVSISTDDGKTWTPENNQPTAQFYHVSTDSQFAYYIYGAQQDSGTVAIASQTDDSGIGEPNWYSVAGGESGFVFPANDDPDLVFAGSYDGYLTRYNRHTGQVDGITEWPDNPMGYAAAGLKYRYQWTAPIALSPYDPKVIYHAAQVLFKSSDRGATWTVISPDLTRNDTSKQQTSGGPITQDNTSIEYYDTIFAITESPAQKDLIWVGTDDGLIQLTRDGGKSWSNVTPKELPAWCTVNLIEASNTDAGTAWAAVDCHRLDNFRPYIFHTTDFGKTWRQLTDGIPDHAYVHAVREDPNQKGLIFAGTETGIFCSRNNGEHWETLQLNLPRAPVYDLTIHNNDLIAATHGRSFWVLDNISPLRQGAAVAANPDVYFFQPAPAYRLRRSTGKGVGQNAGKNPPHGAVIDYWLKETPKSAVKLEILDSSGTVVRAFSSPLPTEANGEKQTEKSEEEIEEQKAETLPAEAGANRFVWDLRYQNPARVPGIELWGGKPQGPLALPGMYQLRLTAGKQILTQPLELRYDPRTKSTSDDLHAQFELAQSISQEINKVDLAANRIISLRTELDSLKKRLGTGEKNANILTRIDDTDKRLKDALFELIDPESLAEEDPVGRPVKINSKLVYLQSDVERSEGRPTPQSFEVFSLLKQQAEKNVAAELAVEQQDISELNKFLSAQGITLLQPAAESQENHE